MVRMQQGMARRRAAGNGGDTRERILQAARRLVRGGGPSALTFDAVAGKLGISKQAVIYWFPKKDDLIAAVAGPSMADEAQAAISALAAESDDAEAVRAYLRAVAAFHLGDLDRFRLMYVAPMMGGRPTRMPDALGERIHALTSSMYDALQARLAGLRGLAPGEARRAAVATHMAVLGFVQMVALTDAVGDPLAHDRGELLEAMAGLLAG